MTFLRPPPHHHHNMMVSVGVTGIGLVMMLLQHYYYVLFFLIILCNFPEQSHAFVSVGGIEGVTQQYLPSIIATRNRPFVLSKQQHQQQQQRQYPAPSSTHVQKQTQTQTRRKTQQPSLYALIPLSPAETEQLVSIQAPTGAQYATYWGRTSVERYGRLVETLLVSLLGVFFSYFLSFVVGGFPATILGFLFLAWGILSPELKAYQRNWEFLGGRPLVEVLDNDDDVYDDNKTRRKERGSFQQQQRQDKNTQGLYSALFVGHIADVCVVEDAASAVEYELLDFADYRMETDELEKWTGNPYLLRVQLQDSAGRELQVHARLSEEYTAYTRAQLQGLPVVVILLSTQASFQRLAALTDLYVPDVNIWIGDYPYLDREAMENLMATDDFVWDTVLAEAKDDVDNVVVDDDLSVQASTRSDTTNNMDPKDVYLDVSARPEEDNRYTSFERPSERDRRSLSDENTSNDPYFEGRDGYRSDDNDIDNSRDDPYFEGREDGFVFSRSKRQHR